MLMQIQNVLMSALHFWMSKHLSIFAAVEHPDDEFVVLAQHQERQLNSAWVQPE
jgi:hypothetical protein